MGIRARRPPVLSYIITIINRANPVEISFFNRINTGTKRNRFVAFKVHRPVRQELKYQTYCFGSSGVQRIIILQIFFFLPENTFSVSKNDRMSCV